ncbi:uncharacterized protein LOC123508108 [Portunus trituberculatus]|uniref:uncharacterized protein LOC123508108 n=1 Tax=Portunus trituberculatus TaxID=210409 RepID=UPI001E1CD249|nr:uncharacterized protein LOC123508108 [Portunus trituberculatus]
MGHDEEDTAVAMSEEGGSQVVVVCEDKATSTDDELLVSPAPVDRSYDGLGPDNCFRYMAHAAQVWGADLVGMERPYSGRGGRYLRHQESLSSNSDVSRPPRQVKLRRQRTSESCDNECLRRPKARELRRQWTTDSSDSGYGYSKRCSREPLRRQDTEESADSTRRLIRDLQRQATTESSSSLRLTRQSSIRSASDNQSLFLMRQSTVDTYDDMSTTDFSRPQSCTASAVGALVDFSPHSFTSDAAHHHHSEVPGQTVLSEYSACYNPQKVTCSYSYNSTNAISATLAAPLLATTSCSLINLSAVDLEAADIKKLHHNLRSYRPEPQKPKSAKRKKSGLSRESSALQKARARVRRRRDDEEMPRKVRWSIMATGLILLLMSVILVGATLKMAPLIDEMVRKENEDIMRELQAASAGIHNNITATQVPSTQPDSSPDLASTGLSDSSSNPPHPASSPQPSNSPDPSHS